MKSIMCNSNGIALRNLGWEKNPLRISRQRPQLKNHAQITEGQWSSQALKIVVTEITLVYASTRGTR
jgi:hypothetical protein